MPAIIVVIVGLLGVAGSLGFLSSISVNDLGQWRCFIIHLGSLAAFIFLVSVEVTLAAGGRCRGMRSVGYWV
jgi:hypothetical protein